MDRGLGQDFGTCWFYSTLNTFLLSDNGFKVMWKKLHEIYEGLSANQKTYFNSNLNVPCPTGGNSIATMNRIYFWKFMDEYMCSIGGPGKLAPRGGRTARLLENFPFTSNYLREAKGLVPARAA